MRNISDELIAASTSSFFTMLIFVKVEFDSGNVYLHNGIGNFLIGGALYEGVGDFGSIDTVQEGAELSPYSVALLLSGLDASLMDEVMNQDYYLRPVTIYVGALDEDMLLVAAPDELWSGFMDSADVTIGEENAIRITCESEMALFDSSNNTRFSDSELQREYPGDLFLQYAEEMIDATVQWGGEDVGKKYGNNTPSENYGPGYTPDYFRAYQN